MSKFLAICRVCGIRGSKKCSGCNKVSYCSRECQTLDWKARHKIECKNPDFEYKYNESEETLAGICLPQFEIIMAGDDEQVSESDDDENEPENVEEQLKELQKFNSEISKEDLEQFSIEENVDKTFKRFQKVVKCAPDQILRYQRLGNPLWMNSAKTPESIPNCEICGSKRIFEFQIMPQLLSSLKLDKSLNEESIDWGILAIYTCEQSCDTFSDSYTQEFIWKQPS